MLPAWFLAFLGAAFPQLVVKSAVTAPTAVIKNGTVIGSTIGSVDTFNGIPFAQPPTGQLRLKPPQSVTTTFGTITATNIPTACPQFSGQVNTDSLPENVAAEVENNPLYQSATVTGEDCLTLNVQRPVNTTASSKLPVLFWIYGGGFESGSTQTYNGSQLVLQSVLLGQPILYVAVNYRLGGFGFLAGKQVQQDGSTNLGLRDQRLGMQWVQENIAAFGGDPDRVTLWGESAGAFSVLDHTVINGGDNLYNSKPLFRGAIMDSGSILPALPVNSTKAQNIYDTVVAAANCSQATDSLACLRTLDYTTFLNATSSVPQLSSYTSLDLSYLPRPDPTSPFFSVSPEISLANGSFTKIPIIIGDQEDEGTIFALPQTNISTTAQLVTYLSGYFSTAERSLVAGFVATYPDNAAAGSPFNTYNANALYPQFKRLAAILGDYTFTLSRRGYLSVVSSAMPTWSYLSTHLYGTPILGTFHGTDVLETYYDLPYIVPAMSQRAYYISFVNHLDPNLSNSTSSLMINWPQYNTSNLQLLNFQALQNGIVSDNFRATNYAYMMKHYSSLRI